MAQLTQLTTPTIRPPSSLDVADDKWDLYGGGQEIEGDWLAQTYGPGGANNTSGGTIDRSGAAPDPNDLGYSVEQFAKNQMANPSRYDSDLLQRGINMVNQEADFSRQRGIEGMDEYYSSRGLVGSSVEGRGRGDFLSQLQRTKEGSYLNLLREMANTYSADVSAAGQMGLSARGQQLEQRALELQQQGMDKDDAYRQALADQQAWLSAYDIYMRALAAGAGDEDDLPLPQVPLFGGGYTDIPGGAGGGDGDGNVPPGNYPPYVPDDSGTVPGWPYTGTPTTPTTPGPTIDTYGGPPPPQVTIPGAYSQQNPLAMQPDLYDPFSRWSQLLNQGGGYSL